MKNAYRFLVLTAFAAIHGCAGAEPGSATAGATAYGPHATAPLELPAVNTCAAGDRLQVAQRLSETGCFEPDSPTTPMPGLIPYSPNAPLWTDGADKTRWLSVPAGSRIEVDDRGDFIFPIGSVLVKHFTLQGRPIETRLLMHHADGWTGYPYQWNEDGSDAVLVMQGARLEGVQPDGSGWTIPSSGSCQSCHTPETHVTMGTELAQLNGPLDHPYGDNTDNQLERLQAIGLLAPIDFPVENLPALVDYNDAQAPLEDRARAYLHANCASCHTAPENICSGDLRWSASLAQMGVCEVDPKLAIAGAPMGTKLLAPGHPEQSALWLRLQADPSDFNAMPPVGREHVDQAGADLVAAWIESLQGCE